MPCIRDKSTVQLVASIFCGEGERDKEQTLVLAKYSKSYARSGKCALLYARPEVIAAIQAIDTKKQEKINYDCEQALVLLLADYIRLEPAADKGNIQAIQARTAISRELNDVVGLHKQRFVDETEQARELTQQEQEEAQRLAGIRLRTG